MTIAATPTASTVAVKPPAEAANAVSIPAAVPLASAVACEAALTEVAVEVLVDALDDDCGADCVTELSAAHADMLIIPAQKSATVNLFISSPNT